MAVAYRSHVTEDAGGASVSAITITKPTGTVADDILLAYIIHGSQVSADPTTVPSGWSIVGARMEVAAATAWIYRKVAGGSEPADYTWSGFSVSNQMAGAMTAYSGGSTTTPIDDFHVEVIDAAASSWVGTVDTTVANCLLCMFGGVDAADVQTWSTTTMTERYDVSLTGTFLIISGHDEAVTTAQQYQRTLTFTGSARLFTGLIALRPAGGGPPPWEPETNADELIRTVATPLRWRA